jgi:hypothetical protein
VNNAKRLSEFLHSAQVSIIAITINTNRYVEFNLVVCIIGLTLANIPWYARTTEHNTSERVVQGVGCRHDTDVFCSADPDSVVCEKFLGLIDTVGKLSGPLVDII